MTRLLSVVLVGVLATSIWLLATPGLQSAVDDEDAEAIAEAGKATDKLKKLVDALAEGKVDTVPGLAKATSGTTSLKHIMWAAYKPRDKGGMGMGATPGSIKPDGIEAKLIAMSRKPLGTAQLEKESPSLIRLAQVAQGMAEVVDLNPPAPAAGKPLEKWVKFNKEQKDAAKDVIDAVKANDTKAVQTAATRLYASCTNCHGVFR
jgi:hypothetical protein